MKTFPSQMAGLVLLAFLAGTLRAQTPVEALNFSGGAPMFQSATTLGWKFDVTAPITVVSLGYFDAGTGFTNHPVGIFDWTSHALLTSATVVASDPLIASALLQPAFGFRYQSITPYNLDAGTYFIGGLSQSDPWFAVASGTTTAAGITYQGGGFTNGVTVLTFPIYDSHQGTAYFGPNFQVGVPEPAMFSAILGGLIGLGTLWCRRHRGIGEVSCGRPQISLRPR